MPGSILGSLLLATAALHAATSGGRLHEQAAVSGGPADFTSQGTQPGLAHGLRSASECTTCHRGTGALDDPYMPHPTWSGTMMANATRDPLFWAALDVANRDVPGVGDYCLRCHTPNGWFAGRASKVAGGGIVDGADGCRLRGDHNDGDSTSNDFEGISCHFCHRLMRTGPAGQVARRENGNAWVDDVVCPDSSEPCRRGPYQYPDPQVGAAVPPHPWLASDFHVDGALCGTCHDVTTPITPDGPLKTLITAAGDSGLPFPIERTFSEWRDSAYADPLFVDGFATDEPVTRAQGQSCQDCHMRVSTEPFARACQFFSHGSRVGNLPVHEFVGANTWIPALLSQLYGGSPGLNRQDAFARTIALAEEMLMSRSASIAVTVVPQLQRSGKKRGGGSLLALVRVTNLSGHKLPTGYGEGRRMWLDVVARDGNGAQLWRSGAYDDATGVLTRDAQLRLYEIRQGIWDDTTDTCETTDSNGDDHFHFVLNDCIASDTRIPPLGFRGGNNLEMQPVPTGQYAETAPGSGVLVNYDDVQYTVPVPADTLLPVTVTATLRHQLASREYIEFLRDQAIEHAIPSETAMCADNRPSPITTGPRNLTRGQFMYDLWAGNGRSPPVTMATSAASAR